MCFPFEDQTIFELYLPEYPNICLHFIIGFGYSSLDFTSPPLFEMKESRSYGFPFRNGRADDKTLATREYVLDQHSKFF